jgi:hypothetical protein
MRGRSSSEATVTRRPSPIASKVACRRRSSQPPRVPAGVEYHLHKVFSKLGIASRAELESVLDDGTARAVA